MCYNFLPPFLSRKFNKAYLLLLICCLFTGLVAEADHMVGANVTYTCVSGNTYRFRISFYRGCEGDNPLPGDYLLHFSNGCGLTNPASIYLTPVPGTGVEVTPICGSATTACAYPAYGVPPGIPPGVQEFIYEAVVTLPGNCASWVFSMGTCCRNGATITTLTNGYASMYVEATLSNNLVTCNNSPQFTAPANVYMCAGQAYTFNVGANDPDGDELEYEIICPREFVSTPVSYLTGASCAQPIMGATTTIDPVTGNVTISTGAAVQVTVMAIRVKEYRVIGGVRTLIGTTMRDLQISVRSCSNASPLNPTITSIGGAGVPGANPSEVRICAGQPVIINFTASDPNTGDIITYQALNLSMFTGATFTQGPAGNPRTATFTWTPGFADVGNNTLTIAVKDNACPINAVTTVTFNIFVQTGVVATPNITVYCDGAPAQINAYGATAYSWSQVSGPAGGLSHFSCTTCPNPLVGSLTMPNGTYVFRVTATAGLPAGCNPFYDVTVNVVDGYTLNMPPNANICGGTGSVTLSTSLSPAQGAGTTYAWAPAAGLSCTNCPGPVASPTVTTTYTLTVTNPAGCVRTGTVTVTVGNPPPPTLNATPGCQGNPSTVVASGGAAGTTYAWFQTNTATTPFFNGATYNTSNLIADTTLWVAAINAGCTSLTRTPVVVSPLLGPLHNVGTDKSFVCIGQSANLTATKAVCRYDGLQIPYAAMPTPAVWNNVYLWDDDATPAITLPFPFEFYCNTYNNFYINSNGFISFGSAYPWDWPWTAPSIWGANNYIALCWDGSLNPGWGGQIRWGVVGVAPNRKVIIEYNNVPFGYSSDELTGYIVLEETTNNIEIHISEQTNSGYHIAGIENALGTDGLYPAGKNYTTWTVIPPSTFAYRFAPEVYNYTWSPGATLSCTNCANPVATPTATTTYTCTVTKAGSSCTATKTITIEVASVVVDPDQTICPGASFTMPTVYTGPTSAAPTSCGAAPLGCPGTTVTSTVGTGTLSNDGYSYPCPFGNWYWGNKHQYLFRASELLGAGVSAGKITAISLYVDNYNSMPTLNNFEVKMKCTSVNELLAFESGLTTVLASTNFAPAAPGWRTITLTTPYNWDGTSNLVIEFCSNNSSWVSNGNASVRYSGYSYQCTYYSYADQAGVCASPPWTYSSTNKPNVRFDVCQQSISYSWSSVPPGFSSTLLNPTITTPTVPTTYTVVVNLGSCTVTDNITITPGSASAVTWVGGSGTGAQRNDWFRVQNWNPTCLPDCNTDVTIPNVPFKPVINGAATAGARDLTILTGSDLTLGVTGKLNVCRHWTQAGTATLTASTSSRVNFVGTGNQNYSRGSGVGLFGRVALNNGSTVTLVDNHLAAADSITFEGGKGRFVTNAHQVQLLNTGTGRIAGHGTSPNGYVQGNFRQNVVNAAAAYDFPVGDVPEPSGKGYQLARIQFSGVGVGTGANQAAYLVGRFDPYAAVPGSDPAILVACPSVTVMPMLDNGYWTINSFNSSNTQVTATGVYNYDVTMFPRNYTNAMPFAQAARNQLLAMGSGTCQPGASVSHTRSSMTGFSEFGVAQSQTPLPVELLSLQARALSNSILVSWQTRSELNCRGFEVQRSVDNWHYESIGWVEGAGTSSVVNSYRLEDTRVVANQRYYYRILQVDYDGSSRLSNVVEAQLGDGIVFGVTAYPNPVNNVLTVKIVSPADELVQVRLYNSLGQSVIQKTGRTVNGVETVVMEMNGLSSGLYQLEVSSANGKAVQQIIKQ